MLIENLEVRVIAPAQAGERTGSARLWCSCREARTDFI
jgi:hypothetical protein